jgi:hypothetical protein
LKTHQVECDAAKAGGAGDTRKNHEAREEGNDREWVSTP